MRRALTGLVYGVVGYAVAAPLGYVLVDRLSANSHDRSVEAAMTAIFLVGPLGALFGLIVGVIRPGRGPSERPPAG